MRAKLYLLIAMLFVFTPNCMFGQDEDPYILWVRAHDMDQGFVDLLTGEGYRVEVKTNTYTGALSAERLDSANNARLIIMSRTCGSGDYNDPDQWNGVTAPLINLSPWIIRNNRWLWLNTVAMTEGYKEALLTVTDPDNPIFKGMGVANFSNVLVYSDSIDIFDFNDVGNGTIIAKDLLGGIAIASWDANQEFYAGSGQTAAGKRIFFSAGLSGPAAISGVLNLTEDGQKMFMNAVAQFYPENETSAGLVFSSEPNIRLHLNGNNLWVDIESTLSQNATVIIFDVSGRMALRSNISLSDSSDQFSVDVSKLGKGIYVFKMENGTEQVARKFMIQ